MGMMMKIGMAFRVMGDGWWVVMYKDQLLGEWDGQRKERERRRRL